MLKVSYCDHAVSVVNFLPCVCSRGHIFSAILMKLGQNVCLYESQMSLKWVMLGQKTRSLGQIIEETMLVTKGLRFEYLLFNAIPHCLQGSGERLQGHHGPLVFSSKFLL